MTNYFYPNVAHGSFSDFVPNMVRFLMNDHPDYTGPGWTLVEAYDSNASVREVPSDPTDLDSLSGSVSWPSASLAAGDWVVLESANSLNSNHFQVYIEYQSTTQLNLLLIPFEDFETGLAAASPPNNSFALCSASIGAGSGSFVTMTGATDPLRYTIVATEGSWVMMFESNSTADINWNYLGEVDTWATGSAFWNPDERPYVIHDSPANVAITTTNYFNRVSPSDNSTYLTAGGNQIPANTADFIFGSGPSFHMFGRQPLMPIMIKFSDLNHEHLAGWLRNVFTTNSSIGVAGTLLGRKYLYRSDDTTPSDPPLVVSWTTGSRYP